MTPTMESIMNEFREEAGVTKRILERVPPDKLDWKPHAKSMSVGQLAMHLASVPGRIAQSLQQDQVEINPENFNPPPPKNMGEILATFDSSCKTAEAFLAGLTQQSALANWSLIVGGKAAFSKPRAAVIRSIMLNHSYHHRGQLSVYLRLLDVPVPIIYGRSADEDPFAM